MTGNRWRETVTRTRPDQTDIYTKLDRVDRMNAGNRQEAESIQNLRTRKE